MPLHTNKALKTPANWNMSLLNLPTWSNKVQTGSMEAIEMAPVPIIIKIKDLFNEANGR